MKKYIGLIFLLVYTLSSCDNLVKKEDKTVIKDKTAEEETTNEEGSKKITEKKTEESESETNSDADILNNVVVQESGKLKVAQAYLSFEDGKLVPKSNKVPLGEPVLLNLVIDKGWKVRDGEVSIDATEIITADNGQMVLNARNLFKAKPAVSESDASRIYLKATITKTRPDIDHFIVNYHVWDNWGDGEVRGSYKLYVADTNDE